MSRGAGSEQVALPLNMDAVEYLDLLLKALLLAGVYSAMAVGMTVIYGVMKIVNLAHAGFLMLGAYFALEMFQRFHIDPILGAVLALPVFFRVRNVSALASGALAAEVRYSHARFPAADVWLLAGPAKHRVPDLGQ